MGGGGGGRGPIRITDSGSCKFGAGGAIKFPTDVSSLDAEFASLELAVGAFLKYSRGYADLVTCGSYVILDASDLLKSNGRWLPLPLAVLAGPRPGQLMLDTMLTPLVSCAAWNLTLCCTSPSAVKRLGLWRPGGMHVLGGSCERPGMAVRAQ